MSEKKFMSYGDAETVLSEYANAIKALDPEGGTLDTRLSAVEDVIPSGASESNPLITETDLGVYAKYDANNPTSVSSANPVKLYNSPSTGWLAEMNMWLRGQSASGVFDGAKYVRLGVDGTGGIFVYGVDESGDTVGQQQIPWLTSTVTSGSTAPITSGAVASSCPYIVFTTVLMSGDVSTYTLAAGHYECKVYYYGGLCGIYDIVRNQFGNNGGRIATVWDNSAFKKYTISVEQSTGVVSMSGTGDDNVQFVITALP